MPNERLAKNVVVFSAQSVARLAALGQLLDSMEQNRIAVSPRQFRKAAREACAIIAQSADNPEVRLTCIKHDSLKQLLQNQLYVDASLRAESEGTTCWCFELDTRTGRIALRF